jgi:leucyl-tRNA synthetase
MYFTAPSDREVIWSSDTLTGVEKFVINKFHPLAESIAGTKPHLKKHFKKSELSADDWKLYIKLNQTIKRVDESYEQLQFNTAISALMELVRDFEQSKPESGELNDYIIMKATQLIAPMAPHLAEEMWQEFGFSKSIFKSDWPQFDSNAIVGDAIVIAVQVNGKLRDSLNLPAGSDQETVETAAFASPKVQAFIDNKEIVKKIYVPGRILNIVVK